MSSPAALAQPSQMQGTFRPSIFLENIIRFLMPYFLPVAPSPAEARADILETLATYGVHTRSAMLSAAQAIAFGFATLETLQEAKDPDLTPAMRLKYRSCANTLTRSAEKADRFLDYKRIDDAQGAPPPQAAQTRPAEPLNDLSDPDAQAAIAFARDQIALHRNKTGNAKPQPARRSSILPSRPGLTPREQEENNRMWGHAMIRALDDMGMPVQLVSAQSPPTPAS